MITPFASDRIIRTSSRTRSSRGWFRFARAALVATVVVGQVAASQDPPPDLTDIVLSTVVLVSPADGAGYGSGTFITPYGHILTNHHVVELPDGTVAEHSFIRISESFTAEPVFRYVAQLVAADRDLDIAILKVVADSSFRPVPSVQRFPYLPVGARSDLRPGQSVVVWGYPGISGRTITSTAGTISGFVGEDLRSSGDRWIKTDAQVAPGNSGGAAITTEGVLVGVPTVITGRALSDQIAVTQNWLRPADLFLEVVSSLPGAEVVSLQTGRASLPQPPTTVPATVPATPESVPEEAVIDLDKVVTTSAELIARLPFGGLITLGEGTFQLTEPIDISTSTRIVGNGSDYTFILSNAEGHALRFSQGETSRLEGVTIQHVDGLVADVVAVRGGQTVEFIDVRLMGAVHDEVLDRGGSGLAVRSDGTVLVLDSYFGQNAKAGLSIEGAPTVNVASGVFDRNQGAGVDMSGGTLVLADSTFTNNGRQAVLLHGTATATIDDSTLDSNQARGFDLRDQAQLVATHVSIRSTQLPGADVFLTGSARAELTGGTISGWVALEGQTQIAVTDVSIQDTEPGTVFLLIESARANLTGGTVAGTVKLEGESHLDATNVGFRRGNSATVEVAESAEVELTEVTFSRSGLAVYGDGVASVTRSRFEDSSWHGVTALDRATVTIVRSEILGSSACGLNVNGSSSVRVESSEIVGSNTERDTFAGICAFDHSSVTVLDTVIKQNGYSGIKLWQRSAGTFEMRDSEISGLQSIPGIGTAGSFSMTFDGEATMDNVINIRNNRLQSPVLGNLNVGNAEERSLKNRAVGLLSSLNTVF